MSSRRAWPSVRSATLAKAPSITGTAAAAAITAGIEALMFDKPPNLTVAQARQNLFNTT